MARSVMKKAAWMVCLLLVASLALVGCGGNGGAGGGTGSAGGASSAGSTGSAGDAGGTNSTDSTPDNGGEAVKDSIVYELYAAPSVLDPELSATNAEWHICMSIYDNLFRAYRQDWTDCRPWMVESYEISDDQTDWTLKLREGILFHDGSELTAEDAAFTLERSMVLPVPSAMVSTFTGITILDTYTVRIDQDVAFAHVPGVLAAPQMGIVNKKAVETYGEGAREAVIGTGPYRLVDWSADNNVTVEYFEDHFMKDDPEYDIPVIKKCVFRPITDTNATTIAFDAGEIDVFNRNVQTSDYERYRADPEVTVHEIDMVSKRGLSMNNETGPFTDVRIRRAMNHALDKVAITLMAADGQHVSPVYTKADYRMEGYDYAEENDLIVKYEYDPDAAIALMAEAGYDASNPLNVSMVSSSASHNVSLAQAMQDYMSQVHVNADIEVVESAQYIQRVSSGNYESASAQWSMDWYLGQMIVRMWCYPGNYYNYEQYANPRVVELIDQASTVFAAEDRAPLFGEVIQLMSEDAVIAPVYRIQGMVVTHNGLHVYADPSNTVSPLFWMHY